MLIRWVYVAHLRQECHNSKSVILQEKLSKFLKCYNFLWVQQRHNCSPAASFVNWVMTLYLLKVHLQTFLSISITKKCQILSCETLLANERYLSDKVKCFANKFGSKTVVHIKWTLHYYFEVTGLIMTDLLFIFTDREIQRWERNFDRWRSRVIQLTVKWGTILTLLFCVCVCVECGVCNTV
jgi:hypothetical protein